MSQIDPNSPLRTLDLHNTKHADVDKRLEDFYLWKGKSISESIIVTGDSSEMRTQVIRFLDTHDFKYVVDRSNTGRIRVIG